MSNEFHIGHVPSEFEIQAFVYAGLKTAGKNVRGEVRCTLGSKKSRFDLMVFNASAAPKYAVEIKPKRGAAWRKDWEKKRPICKIRSYANPCFYGLRHEAGPRVFAKGLRRGCHIAQPSGRSLD